MKISVILPTYNEREGIIGFVENILKVAKDNNLDLEILVIDDSSPDGTGELCQSTFRENPTVRVIIRKEKGLATAIKTGIENSIGDAILLMDADGNYDPNYIPIFAKFFPEFDVISGSRYIRGGKMLGSRLHYLLSFIFSLIVKFFLGLKATDATNGLILFKKELFNKLNINEIFKGRHGEFFVALLYAFKKLKIRFKEIPVVCRPRSRGKSKTSLMKHPFFYAWRALKCIIKP